ncbi:MAG: hypothetical protein M1514_03120, partial [Patescibacteria group bacterium]|nr:hypothetical protein [Patescibacteria group bacterium]
MDLVMKQRSSKPIFQETGVYPSTPGRKEILSKRINELSLKIQGSRLEGPINKLYKELEEKGITFKPKCYLSDEWGCPSRVPIIGIPFYLADPQLSELETELTGVEAENDQETMMYLRHEAGHAFNYAYSLYLHLDWQKTFGSFFRPYREYYRPKPFSPSYVRNVPGWYAQKHPDEDFAESFAVWLTPGSEWEKKYLNTPAIKKLLYVEKVVKKFGKKTPAIIEETTDEDIEE